MLLTLVILYMIYFCAIYFMFEIFEALFFLVEIFWQLVWLFLKLLFQVIGEFYELVKSGTIAVWYWSWPLLKRLGRATFSYGKKLARGIGAMLVFLYYLADEALRGGEAGAEDEPDEERAQNDSYEKALRLLGLQDGYTKESFKHAFKSAMARAHPDKGGTHEQAMALNAARNIVKTHNGWR